MYNHLKNKLSYLEDNPAEYLIMLWDIHTYLNKLEQEIYDEWTYCPGCGRYVKKIAAYEDITLTPPHRPVLRCCNCRTIWKYLD